MKNKIPIESEIKKLHRKVIRGKYKKRYFELVWTHGLIVKEISLLLAHRLQLKDVPVREDIIIAGALLHDIGMYRCRDEDLYNKKSAAPVIEHGIIGGK